MSSAGSRLPTPGVTRWDIEEYAKEGCVIERAINNNAIARCFDSAISNGQSTGDRDELRHAGSPISALVHHLDRPTRRHMSSFRSLIRLTTAGSR